MLRLIAVDEIGAAKVNDEQAKHYAGETINNRSHKATKVVFAVVRCGSAKPTFVRRRRWVRWVIQPQPNQFVATKSRPHGANASRVWLTY
jgi:hypothetical protein